MEVQAKRFHAETYVELERHKVILLAGLKELNTMERKAIFLRFWLPSSIAQVAIELRVSWDVADQTINGAIEKLRRHFAQENILYMNVGSKS